MGIMDPPLENDPKLLSNFITFTLADPRPARPLAHVFRHSRQDLHTICICIEVKL